MAMLEVKDLEVYYGVIQAIKGISFHVDKGEIIALIGANGAGKTTTLHTVTGLISPKNGHVLFEGKDITKIPAHKIVSMGMAQGRSAAASSRCSRWDGRLCQSRRSSLWMSRLWDFHRSW